MLKYYFVAKVLKFFSLNSTTRMFYRQIGNLFGQEKRKKTDIEIYRERGFLLLNLCQKYDVILPDDKVLELGTGWMHWFSIFLRIYYDASMRISMMDVWDNRQFKALQVNFKRLEKALTGQKKSYPASNEIFHQISLCENFEELYVKLNLEYVIDTSGNLGAFDDESLKCIFSFHVLEHVSSENVEHLVSNMYRLLKPGGFLIHQIGIDDHLAHYDTRVSPKNYIRYSDETWLKKYENVVQYFNRLQVSDWLSIFNQQGFILKEKITETCTIDNLDIDEQYARYSKEDLACTILTLVYQKPDK
ncbi:MAG: methyltransferase domain-containing protein [Candidatus Omnitrophica bacterium]|nr:methyltransferase domain-containing protein [Candidatus Omnitrophota bacterium]